MLRYNYLYNMLQKIKEINRTQLILLLVTAATIPCYCLGIMLLWSASIERASMTATAGTITETLSGSDLPTFTVPAATRTATPTPTMTLTFTSTITYVLPPTNTTSPTLTATNTPVPTKTDTPVPPTDTATLTATGSEIPDTEPPTSP